ncbi:MAG: permease-like cell division protein FtsX [Gammaproteobacteria bacterium]|jgi:cell division transport system permease protein
MQRQVNNYFIQHLQALVASLGAMWRAPFASAMTLLVIAIALALPAGLYLFVHNLQTITADWQSGAQLSIFVKDDVTDERARIISQEIEKYPGVGKVDFLTRDAAFAEFKSLSGFSEMLDTLPENPLPAVIIVHPTFTDPVLLQKLEKTLKAVPEVALVQLDMEWAQRLSALLIVGEKFVWILMSFLCMAVVLIIGNTIRLAIFNRQDEIAIIKLVGGTNAFIRRPFLYTGILYGLLGSLLAIIMIYGAVWVLHQPVETLANAYQSDYQILGLNIGRGVDLLFLGTLLGWLGAAIFVHYHLKRIEP